LAVLAIAGMKNFKDYYRVLRVGPTADDAAIKAAFRRLARRHHPDVATDERAADRFREICEAYEVLSDPDKRRQYHRVYRAQRPPSRMGGAARGRRDVGARGTARSGGFGINVDLLGLRVGLAVAGDLVGPRTRRQKGTSTSRRRLPRQSER
jgi:curved DNA-binding protein CbpA